MEYANELMEIAKAINSLTGAIEGIVIALILFLFFKKMG